MNPIPKITINKEIDMNKPIENSSSLSNSNNKLGFDEKNSCYLGHEGSIDLDPKTVSDISSNYGVNHNKSCLNGQNIVIVLILIGILVSIGVIYPSINSKYTTPIWRRNTTKSRYLILFKTLNYQVLSRNK